MLAVAEDGSIYVTRRDVGDVVLLKDTNGDGRAEAPIVVARRPQMHGIALTKGQVFLVTVKEVFVAERKADGTFATATDYPAGNTHTVATGDLDGDGHLDLAAGGYDEGFVRVLRGAGDGTFAAVSPIASGALALSVAVADLNGDGKPDVAVQAGAGSMSIFLGT